MKFTADEAKRWKDFGFEPDWTAEFHDAGIKIEDLQHAWDRGIGPDDYLALHNVVDEEDMLEWLGAIGDRDLVESVDVARLVKAKITPGQVWTAPDDLTAGEIIAYVLDPDAYWTERLEAEEEEPW